MLKTFEKSSGLEQTRPKKYWKQLEGWVTGLWNKYEQDIYLKTILNIVVTQILGLGVIYLCFFALSPNPLLAVSLGLFFIFAYALVVSRVVMSPMKKAIEFQKRFISDIAHELRTPLSIIRTNSEVILLEDNVGSRTKEMMLSTVDELGRSAEIINNLLSLNAFIRPEKMKFGEVDIGNVIDHAAENLRNSFEKKKIILSIKKRGPNLVWGNRTALEQVAENLLRNALLETEENGHVSVIVEPDWEGNNVLIVRDTGVGIEQGDLFRVFPFYKNETSLDKLRGGKGIGLIIANELLKMHSAKISVRNVAGKGTAITVALPAKKEKRPALVRPVSHELSIDFLSY